MADAVGAVGMEVGGVERGEEAVAGGQEVRAEAVGRAVVIRAEVFPLAAEILEGEAPEAVGNMIPRVFINELDDARIVEAIAKAELQSSGEIRVFISEHEVADALVEAKKQFTALGMEKTALRNGVLIYVAPKSQTFAVVGDSGVHAKCGEHFWDATTKDMRALLKEGKFTEALISAIQSIGEVLKQNFPRASDDRNELPNQIEGDR
jgi:uncharacterized membrane protein